MKGCRTVAEYVIKSWMEQNGFVMSEFTVNVAGNIAVITDKTGDSLKVRYDCESKKVEVVGAETHHIERVQMSISASDSLTKSWKSSVRAEDKELLAVDEFWTAFTVEPRDGIHEEGLGWNPNGVFCGECSNTTCISCPIKDTMPQKGDIVRRKEENC